MTGIYTKYINDLPVMPKVVSMIININENAPISSKEIEEIIKIDPYLTARLLKIANSSYYSREREISSIKDTITLLGLKKVKAVCMLIVCSESTNNKSSEFFISYWKEAIYTAFIAADLAKKTGKKVIEDDIFTAGILHNIGQSILHNFSEEKYNKVLKRTFATGGSIDDSEIDEFGITSKKVAAGVLKNWNFPQLLIDSSSLYLDVNSHSKFQSIVDTLSIARLIYLNYIQSEYLHNFENLILTYQSRLNLRKSDLDFYNTIFYEKLEKCSFFNLCRETINE